MSAPSIESARVLLVDDDEELVALLQAYLENDGFRVLVAYDGESAVQSAILDQPDIAIIDVMMPAYSGIEALRRIRTRSNMPVLMLTGRGDEESRILGLELGADDYVAKPCPAPPGIECATAGDIAANHAVRGGANRCCGSRAVRKVGAFFAATQNFLGRPGSSGVNKCRIQSSGNVDSASGQGRQ